jgi:hypothetical protein
MLVMLFKEENVNVMAVNNLNVRIPENNKSLIIN